VLAEGGGGTPEVILIATGSEVQIALSARDLLQRDGTSARVVSMPCVEWFAEQDASYQEQVLPPGIRAGSASRPARARLARLRRGRRASASAWSTSGAQPPTRTLYEEFGLTAQRVAAAARSSLARLSAVAASE